MSKPKRSDSRVKKLEPLERIANLLALLLVKDLKPGEAMLQLWRAGFPDDEIAEILNTTVGSIRQTRYMISKKRST